MRAGELAVPLVEALYRDAVALANEARDWFDAARAPLGEAAHPYDGWEGRQDPALGVALACESLRLTSRLMHIIAWAMERRGDAALDRGPEWVRTGSAQELARLPDEVRRMIAASQRLYQRAEALVPAPVDLPGPGGAAALQALLGRRFGGSARLG